MKSDKTGKQVVIFDGTKPVYSPLPFIILIVIFLMISAAGMMLTPSPDGVGTHESLGLPPCGFLVITGYPCPSCGLTTSISLLLHGQIFDAFRVQPFGVILFVSLFIIAGLSITALLIKIPFSVILNSNNLERVQLFLLTSMIIAWIYKIYIMKWK